MAGFVVSVVVFSPLLIVAPGSSADCSVTKDCVDCSFRGLDVVPDNLPPNISCLDMMGNFLSKFDCIIWQKYPNLQKLSVARNSIQDIDDTSFTFLGNLTMLDISLNKIRYDRISENAFKPLSRLIYLDMKQNFSDILHTEHYPSSLSQITTLETLMIDGLDRQNIPYLPNLTTLYFSGRYGRCNISVLEIDDFSSVTGIENLFMSNCTLEKIGNKSMKILPNISSLDVSWNKHLGFQAFADIAASLENNQKFKRLNLNNINDDGAGSITLTLQDVTLINKLTLSLVTMEGNSIDLLDQGTVFFLSKSLKYISVRDNIMMRGRYADDMIMNGSFVHLIYYDTSEQFQSHIPDHLKGPEVEPEMTDSESVAVAITGCGKMFTRCAYADYFQIIDERIKQFNITPVDQDNGQSQTLQNQIEYLDLSNNSPGTNKHAMAIFKHSPNIKFLNISNNRDGYHHLSRNETFLNFSSLRFLDLSNNDIKYIHSESFSGLTNLQKLYLSKNLLQDTTVDNIRGLISLDYLDLGHNHITTLSKSARQMFDALPALKINLIQNRLLCTCKNTEFVSWMVQNRHKFENLDETKCSFDNTSRVSLKYLKLKEFQMECIPHTYFTPILVVGLCVPTFIIVVICALVYRFKWNLRYLYYMTKFKFLGEYQPLKNREFERDVFVSYADEDRAFVCQSLLLELENKGGVSLLIHERDFKAGELVVDNIMHAITSSRRTLVVMSKAYIKSKWCMYELNMARMEAADTGRNVLCVIMKENIPTNHFPLEVIEIMKRKTYLEYPESDPECLQGFWERLRATLTANNERRSMALTHVTHF